MNDIKTESIVERVVCEECWCSQTRIDDLPKPMDIFFCIKCGSNKYQVAEVYKPYGMIRKIPNGTVGIQS